MIFSGRIPENQTHSSVMHTKDDFCVKDSCPNPTKHKSGYCQACRTLNCIKCGKQHTTNDPPFTFKMKFCANCRRNPKNVRDAKEGKYK